MRPEAMPLQMMAMTTRGDDHQSYAGKEGDGVALGRSDVIDDYAEHQRDAYSQREGDGHAGEGDGGREENVGGVEDDASEDDAAQGPERALREIVDEMAPFGADAAECEANKEGEEDHADYVVPVVKLVAPGLGGEFLCVAP